MLEAQRILAVVPARSGSRGIRDKNLQPLNGISLIGLVGRVLEPLSWIDRRIISTDSAEYAREGQRYGLEAPFLRPGHLSTDTASAVETVTHALHAAEKAYGERYELIMLVEPTSPFRLPTDLEGVAHQLVERGADSVVTVSPFSSKNHPMKALRVGADHRLEFYLDHGRSVVARQTLEPLHWRNGICYMVTRACLLEQQTVFGRHCLAHVTPHLVVNIDEPWELDWAQFALDRKWFSFEAPTVLR
jgi:CMP-N-acetylneuraminic acid synthetase